MYVKTLLLIGAATLALAGCGSPEERAANYLAVAQKHYDAGDYVKARLEAQNAVQVAPRNAKARYLLANIAEQQEEYQQMFGHLLVAVNEDPDNVEGRLKLGTLYVLGKAWAEADQQADALLRQAPNDARAHLLKARVLIQRGDQSGALAQVETALKLDPDNTDAIQLKVSGYGVEKIDKSLAILEAAIMRLPPDKTRQLRELRIVLLAQASRIDEVEVGLRELARDFPKEQGYPFQLAQFYSSQGRMDEAIQLLQKVTELDPKNADQQLQYVKLLESQGDAKKAEETLKAFIGINPEALKLPLALARLLEASKRVGEARKVYVELGKRSPKSPEGLIARFRVAAIDYTAGKADAARATLDSILKDSPDEATALLLRAAMRFKEGKNDEAIGDARGVLRKEPNNDKALLLLANAYLRTKDVVLAKDTFRRLLEVAPESAGGLRQLARLYAADKDYAEAEALLRKRVFRAPDDLIASVQLVEALMAQGATARAEEEARRTLALKNQAGIGDYLLGRVLTEKQDWTAAADAFGKSVALRPGDFLPLEGLVSSLLAADRSAEAISILNKQLDNKQNEGYSKFVLGGIYAREGSEAKAESYLEDVLREQPRSLEAWATLATVYKDQEDRIRVLQRAVKAVPDSPEVRMLLAAEFERGGRFEDAMVVYEGVLKARPKYEAATNNLASLLLDQRTDKASHSRALKLAQGMATSAESPALLDTLGWAYYRAGRYSEAVSLLERVVARAGQVPIFRYHLGMSYLRAGNPVGARQELRRAVDEAKADYPGLAEARATVEKLDKPS